MSKVLTFTIGTLCLVLFSWRAFRHPGSHGFYRFFMAEALLASIIVNAPVWFDDPLIPRQLISWFLLFGSLLLAVHGFVPLHRLGNPREAEPDSADFSLRYVLELARKAYRDGRANFEIVPEKSVLLVIDMQDEFVRPHWTPYWVPEATRQVPRIKRLIDFCRDKAIPVIFTVYSKTHHDLDRPASGSKIPNRYPDLNIDRSKFFAEGRVWHELVPRENEIVIHKPSYGAFYDTPLETILKNLGKDTVVICGTLTNFRCGTTARQAYERSFNVILGSDITATDDPDLQEPELQVLRKGFALVLNCEEIIRTLSHEKSQAVGL